MVCLDTYQDNLCLWRCLAVYEGARPDRSKQKARQLAQSFYQLEAFPQDVPKTSLDELDKVEQHFNHGKRVSEWLGIRVYEPEKQADKIIWRLLGNPNPKLTNILTIGVFEGHAFVLKKIETLADNYLCPHCQRKSTRTSDLQRHIKTCSRGETVVSCPNEKIEKPPTQFEKAFFPKLNASPESIRWLEKEAKRRGIHIHHAYCGHGGEVRLLGNPFDGFHIQSKTVFQYHKCWWHGCPRCYPNRITKIAHNEKTREDLYQATCQQTKKLRQGGLNVVEAWSCCVKQTQEALPPIFTRTYPHAIIFDLEAYGNKTKRKDPTPTLCIENIHKPICFSIGNTLEREPTHICGRDPKALMRTFVEEIERQGERIWKEGRKTFLPEIFHLLPKVQKVLISGWCDEVPVLGFNSGRYDLNLMKEYLYEILAETTKKSRVAKNANKMMFLLTQKFRFLDIINYLGPGTSYDRWVKAYGCEAVKSWFAYEWFDSPDKLYFPGLPDHPEWYSSLKGEWVLTPEEWKSCVRTFEEKGMKTFADWLRYYDNLDVARGLKALDKMLAFYTEKGIDILKDAVSIPGVSLHYMLKKPVVGGPSLVFTRHHEVGVTHIRSHQVDEPKPCGKILGYDANALYLSTMLQDMPCGKEHIINVSGAQKFKSVPKFLKCLQEGKWFGFAEVDLKVPEVLVSQFEEMCPFFINKEVPQAAVPDHMMNYLQRTGRNRGNGRKLAVALSAEKMLAYTPLLRWYVNHGLEITAVHRTINYKPKKIFTWFVEQVTEARRTGDLDKSKALLADVFKLLGNSAYGKMIEALPKG